MTALQGELIDIIRRACRRRSRGKAFGKFLIALLTAWLSNLIAGLWLMLAVGIIHHEWIRSCPTIGYWWSVLLVGLLRPALSTATGSKESDR